MGRVTSLQHAHTAVCSWKKCNNWAINRDLDGTDDIQLPVLVAQDSYSYDTVEILYSVLCSRELFAIYLQTSSSTYTRTDHSVLARALDVVLRRLCSRQGRGGIL